VVVISVGAVASVGVSIHLSSLASTFTAATRS